MGITIRYTLNVSVAQWLTHSPAVHMIESSIPAIELRFDQIKRPGQHMNSFVCAALGKPLMPAYRHGKDYDRLPVLTSLATTSDVTLCRWHIMSPWTCLRAEHPPSSS